MTELDQESSENNLNSLYEEVGLRDLLRIMWEGKKIIILMTSAVALLAVVYSLILKNLYSSESVLVSLESQGTGSLSQYSGLASLAGLSIPSSGSDPVIEMIEIIKSREFVKHLVTFEDILPSMLAAKSYDAASKKLYFDPKIYNAQTKSWTREPSKSQNKKPSYLEAHRIYLDELLSISQDNQTGLVFMSVEHMSPVFAKDFLQLIIKEANYLKRKKDIDTSDKALVYLKKELSQTTLAEMKGSINQLIEAQLETQMMAKINEEYSLVIIEPPFIPEQKSKPGRALIVILATIIGCLLSIVFVITRHYFLNYENKNTNTII